MASAVNQLTIKLHVWSERPRDRPSIWLERAAQATLQTGAGKDALLLLHFDASTVSRPPIRGCGGRLLGAISGSVCRISRSAVITNDVGTNLNTAEMRDQERDARATNRADGSCCCGS